MKQKVLLKLIFTGVLILITTATFYCVFKKQIQLRLPKQKSEDNISQLISTLKPSQSIQNILNFTILYPPTPSSFGCNPYSEVFKTQQGKVIQNYDQWVVLYDELLKNCYIKTKAPQIINFSKKTILSVFAGSSCEGTRIRVKSVYVFGDKLIVRVVTTLGGCSLPSFSFPFTLISIDKTDLPVEFIFEPTQ